MHTQLIQSLKWAHRSQPSQAVYKGHVRCFSPATHVLLAVCCKKYVRSLAEVTHTLFTTEQESQPQRACVQLQPSYEAIHMPFGVSRGSWLQRANEQIQSGCAYAFLSQFCKGRIHGFHWATQALFTADQSGCEAAQVVMLAMGESALRMPIPLQFHSRTPHGLKKFWFKNSGNRFNNALLGFLLFYYAS